MPRDEVSLRDERTLVLIAREGRPVEAMGATGEGSPWELASVTKVLTALVLADAGELHTPLEPPFQEGTTVLHVLLHTSGGVDASATPPGWRRDYCNACFREMGDQIAGERGTLWGTFASDRILKKLGLSNVASPSALGPDSGLAATEAHLSAFLEMWVGCGNAQGSPLCEAIDQLNALPPDPRFPPVPWSHKALSEDGSSRRHSHSGTLDSAGAELNWYPEEATLILLLTRQRYRPEYFESLRSDLEEYYFGERYDPVRPDPASAFALAGEWRTADGEVLVIEPVADDRLRITTGSELTEYTRFDGRFFAPAVSGAAQLDIPFAVTTDNTLEVLSAPNGEVLGLFRRNELWTESGLR